MAMNKTEHLLACIGEEAGEIQQEVSKALRFGLYDHGPGRNTSNYQRTYGEVHDIIAVFEMLIEDQFNERFEIDRDRIEQKKAKVEHYLEYSLTSGG